MLASIVRTPEHFWAYADLLQETFSAEAHLWNQVSEAITKEAPLPSIPVEWQPAADPSPVAQRLADLRQRRLLADLQERVAQAMSTEQPAEALIRLLEDGLADVQTAIREIQTGSMRWGPDLVKVYLAAAEERRRLREENGTAIVGIPTGLSRLDDLLNGLGTGLYILAGAPGAGKTTLALQLAMNAARERIPALYVTYENSPSNLVGKAMCASAGVSPADVDRGTANLAALRAVDYELRAIVPYLAIIEGTSRLSVPEVRAKALQVMNRHKASRCLVVFDYLQRAAQSKGFDALRHNVSCMAGDLRDLANRLGSPILALSSQSRSGGNYGAGGGTANLDSLKESGDLEYSADVVIFLRQSAERMANPPARAVDLVLAKNRFGDVGSVPLIFRADIGQLRQERLP
jgi:replicative DNA helicase